MPNHCCNTLYVPEKVLSLIAQNYIVKDEHGEEIFDFERITPVGDVPDWYEQWLEKWGTKWVGYSVSIGDDCINFDTAWSPPIPIIKKLAELYKDAEFRLEYDETGMGFRGIATAKWQDGEALLDDQCWDMTRQDFIDLGYEDFLEAENAE